jgi:hypothetical protein
MSLAELIPLVNNLSQSDKLSLFKLIATQIPNAELQVIFSTSEYPIRSPYDAFVLGFFPQPSLRRSAIAPSNGWRLTGRLHPLHQKRSVAIRSECIRLLG